MNYPILTFSGLSGVGKTTIVRSLLERSFCQLIKGFTTRARRESDLPGEYKYVTPHDFEEMEKEGEFPWGARFAGNCYGIKRSAIDNALGGSERKVMILTPDVIPYLYRYTSGRIHPIFLYVSSTDILRQRMELRGDTSEAIQTRLQDVAHWKKQAASSGIPFVFIDNSGSLDETVRLVEEHCR